MAGWWLTCPCAHKGRLPALAVPVSISYLSSKLSLGKTSPPTFHFSSTSIWPGRGQGEGRDRAAHSAGKQAAHIPLAPQHFPRQMRRKACPQILPLPAKLNIISISLHSFPRPHLQNRHVSRRQEWAQAMALPQFGKGTNLKRRNWTGLAWRGEGLPSPSLLLHTHSSWDAHLGTWAWHGGIAFAFPAYPSFFSIYL